MKKQVVNVSAVQSAKVMGVLYVVCSLPFLILFAFPAFTGGQQLPWMMLIFMPIIYGALGFIFSLFGAWVYNLVAARVGGFEFTTVEVADRS